jgi:hypothetical protein
LDLRSCRGQFGFAILPPLDFLRDGQTILQRRAVGLLRFGQRFFDLQILLLDRFASAFAALDQRFGDIQGQGTAS